MFAVVVTFTLKPGCMQEFLPLMQDNAQTSQRDEPGCRQFDIATDPARPDEVFLYELYTGEDAFTAHLGTAHFATFTAKTDAMIADKSVLTYKSVHQ